MSLGKESKGETKTAYPPQHVMCMQWKDKRDVRMISSCIPYENVSVIPRGKEFIVPLVINIYNNMMVGLDRSDQTMNYTQLNVKDKKIVQKM